MWRREPTAGQFDSCHQDKTVTVVDFSSSAIFNFDHLQCIPICRGRTARGESAGEGEGQRGAASAADGPQALSGHIPGLCEGSQASVRATKVRFWPAPLPNNIRSSSSPNPTFEVPQSTPITRYAQSLFTIILLFTALPHPRPGMLVPTIVWGENTWVTQT